MRGILTEYYLDAIDGSSIFGKDAWYYSTKFVVEIVKNLKHPVGMEMSAMETSLVALSLALASMGYTLPGV